MVAKGFRWSDFLVKSMAKFSLRGLGFSVKKEDALMDGGLDGAMVALHG